MKNILFILGTRPEAIKLYSPIVKCREKPGLLTQVCLTNQHTDLVRPFLKDLGIDGDFTIPDESADYSLHQLISKQLEELERVFLKANPDLIVVQGDTTSAFSGALAGHYSKIPVAHIEAGLRTDHLFSPWPEEAHRRIIDLLASHYFVPTLAAKEALLKEKVAPESIWVVGNTSVDALSLINSKIKKEVIKEKRSIVVTIHRRENQDPLNHICYAIKEIAQSFEDVEIFFFLHPNPAIRETVQFHLDGVRNIYLMQPVDHVTFIEFMLRSTFIITDSGGIQEEAPYLGKPILVARDTTERPEGIDAGTARLIGTLPEQIIAHSADLLNNPSTLSAMSKVHEPYGKGNSGTQIADIIEQVFL